MVPNVRRGACRTARKTRDVVDFPSAKIRLQRMQKLMFRVAGQTMLGRAVDVDLIKTAHDLVAQAGRGGPKILTDSCGISCIASFARPLPSPTMPGTLSVPETHARVRGLRRQSAEPVARGDSYAENVERAHTPWGHGACVR